PHDPEAARALLAQAGLRDQNGDRFVDRPDGTPFAFRLLIPANSETNRDLAQKLRADPEQVGVRMLVEPIEYTTLVARISGAARDFDAVLLGWSSSLRADLHDIFHSRAIGTPYQFASYSNPRVDELIDAVSTTPDRAVAT